MGEEHQSRKSAANRRNCAFPLSHRHPREFPRFLDVRHQRQRRLAAIGASCLNGRAARGCPGAADGPPDSHVRQIAQAPATFRRIPHNDLDFVAPSLDPLHLRPVQPCAHLRSHRSSRQAGGLAFRRQFNLQMPPPEGQIVVDPIDARQGRQGGMQLPGRAKQRSRIVVPNGIGMIRLRPDRCCRSDEASGTAAPGSSRSSRRAPHT